MSDAGTSTHSSTPSFQMDPSIMGMVPSRTNTLSITPVPRDFFHSIVQDTLRSYFESFGTVSSWVPLPSFGRIIVVFFDEDHAETAKLESDPLVLDNVNGRDIVLRVYRADPSPVNAPPDHLRPPELEKNFLISPPGSPPVGWEQIKEEPPNSAPLADDLMVALRKLALRQKSKRDSVEILIQPEDACGVGVYLEDCDGAEDDDDDDDNNKPAVDWAYGEDPPLRSKWAYAPTAMPPRPTT